MFNFKSKVTRVFLATGMITGLMTMPTAGTALAEGKSAGDLLVRGRLLAVEPDVESTVTVIGGEVDVDGAIVPEVDFTWFWTDNIATELILATTKHDVMVKGSGLGDVDLGSIWLLPPTITMQYHFQPKEQWSPYIGAGVNYTFFFNEDLPAAIVTGVDYENSFGLALQAGVDFTMSNGWIFNVDIKKLYLQTDVTVNGAIEADVDLDPIIFGIGFGRIF